MSAFLGRIIHFFEGAGLSGLALDLVSCALFAVLVMGFVVVFGSFIERVDTFLTTAMAQATGRRAALFIINRVMFVGTVFHELSHALFAIVTGAKVKKIRCFTLFSKDMLGYVEFIPQGGKVKKALQTSLTSCAPVLTGFVTVPFFFRLGLSDDVVWWLRAPCFYVSASIACHMSMSVEDLKLYGRGAVFTYPILVASLYAYRVLLMPV